MIENNNLKSIIENKKPIELVQEIEEVIEKQETIIATIKVSQFWHSISYIGSPDSNIWAELDQNIVSNRHITSSPFNNFCLGCLCTGGDYSGNPKLNFSQTLQFSSGGKLILETPESGTQEVSIPPQGGVVKFEVQGNRVILSLEPKKVERVSSNEVVLFDEETKRMIRKSEKGKTINLAEEI